MRQVRSIGWCAVVCCACGPAYGQAPAPIADPTEQRLLPSGISELPVTLNAQRVLIFKDPDGTDALHFTGSFTLALGTRGQKALAVSSGEAVVWVSNRTLAGRSYRHLELFLWRDAQIKEVCGTFTAGPALFVTLRTFGEIRTRVDDLAHEASLDSRVYREGNGIRSALAEGTVAGKDENVHLRVFDVSGLGDKGKKPPAPRPTIRVRSGGDLTMTPGQDGRNVLTVTGGVYLSRNDPSKEDFIQIQADSVVVFLPSSGETTAIDEVGAAGLGAGRRRALTDDRPRFSSPNVRAGSSPRLAGEEPPLLATGFGEMEVEAAYLEGDVVLRQGPNMIRASRLYYDFMHDRALILDAVVRTTILKRNIPLYLRASELRQLSQGHFAASDAMLTTSEFHTPHYHVGAGHIELIDRTPPGTSGRSEGLRSGTFNIEGATLSIGGRPIFYWPWIRGNVDTSETAIKNLRTGFSDDFGVELEMDFHAFNVLGLETPEGFDATLSLDLYTQRGPAVGIDATYNRDRYFGTLRSYLLTDNDEDFLGRERERSPRKDVRGRLLIRHRQYLENDWQATFELSYISDRGFLEEFFESEFDREKEQETLLYLKKQHDNWAYTAQIQSRILDFTTQTERFPDLTFHLAGKPVAGQAVWYSENRLGVVRYRPATQSFRELIRDGRRIGSGAVSRADSRQEIEIPLDVGPLRIVPFVAVRGTVWDDSIQSGGITRTMTTYGVRGSAYFSRVFPDARSTLFDVDGIRHIVKPELVAWISQADRNSEELFPFDETVEGIDAFDGVALGIRQRWQTRRGGGETRRIVDFVTLDVEIGAFNDTQSHDATNGFVSYSRPENGIARNHINSALIWRMNDRTALLSEMNYDLNDGEIDIFNVSLAVERSPRFSYLLGYRFIEESNSNLFGFDLNYRMTEKHTLALREAFDVARGESLDMTLALIRKFPRWFGAISFTVDESEDDFGISLSIWPEGLPSATLGSRRFTDLGTTTRLGRD